MRNSLNPSVTGVEFHPEQPAVNKRSFERCCRINCASNVSTMQKDLRYFESEMSASGFSIFRQVVPETLLHGLRSDIPRRLAICSEWQKKNGLDAGMDGSAHHVVGGEDSLNAFLCSLFLDDYIKAYFGAEYILNSYGAVDNATFTANTYKHGQRFHRDVRTFSGDFRLMLNMLVMVNDFTIENGATKLAPGTHRLADRPTDDYLEVNSIRAIGKAGDILLFDSNLWHSAAPNLTNSPRMALTLTFTRAFVKQQMDYPRMLGEDFPPNERVRQVLGYNSRVPCGYDEWYQPPEKRMYKPGQG
jgi:hypothetical protein